MVLLASCQLDGLFMVVRAEAVLSILAIKKSLKNLVLQHREENILNLACALFLCFYFISGSHPGPQGPDYCKTSFLLGLTPPPPSQWEKPLKKHE